MSLRSKYAPKIDPAPPNLEPSIMDMAGGLAVALGKWATNGFPVVSEAEYAQRRAICEPCKDTESGMPNFNPTGYAGMGKCRVCGCTGYKLILKTEKCPLAKW